MALAKRQPRVAARGAPLIGRRGGSHAPFALTTGGAAGTLVKIQGSGSLSVRGERGRARPKALDPRADIVALRGFRG
jgi:hypothetical protein